MVQRQGYNGTMLGRTFSLALNNFTFDRNLYWIDQPGGIPSGALLWNSTVNSARPPTGETFDAWQRSSRDKGSVLKDPLLNASTYVPSPDSPVFALGFQPIDASAIGPRPEFAPTFSEAYLVAGKFRVAQALVDISRQGLVTL